MKPKDIIKALEPWMKIARRPAWRPIVEEGDGSPTDSKFGGMPWSGPHAPWPECRACKVPMALFFQLRLGDLPEGPGKRHGKGLLQFFYCPRGSECLSEFGYIPFKSVSSCVRIIRPIPRAKAASPPPGAGAFLEDEEPMTPNRIVGWTQFDDLPDPGELEENGLKTTYDFDANTIRLECPELGFDVTNPTKRCEIEDIVRNASGDKLGGWPMWVQSVEYPFCPKCGRRMDLIFQVCSRDHASYAFGDFGTGHITQCPDHKDVLAFDSAR
jgi:uncharacterized protein YwqG